MSITTVIPENVSGVYILSSDGFQPCAPPRTNRKGELIQVPDIPLKLFVHERSHADILAHLGIFAFTGSRRGADLTLTATEMPLKKNETHSEEESNTAEMKLTFSNGQWIGTFSLRDGATVNVSLEKQRDLHPEAIENLAEASRLLSISDLCSVIDTIVNYILDALEIEIGDLLRPMSICGVEPAGRGAYIFGQSAPGSKFPPIGLSTVYVPWDLVACGTTKTQYSFGLTLGDFWGNPSTILNIVEDIASFLKPLGINVTDFLESLKRWLDNRKEEKFAVVFQLSTKTLSKGLYFLNNFNITTDTLNNASEYEWFRILKEVFSILAGGNIYLYAGSYCWDKWDANNGPFPTSDCCSPFWFMYVFGTAQVYFD